MLQITVPEREYYDEENEMFIYVKRQTLTLEHSLLSVKKWESKWKKPFLGNTAKTVEESIDYARCMTITPNVDPRVYMGLTREDFRKINEYIDDSATATWFSEEEKSKVNPRSKGAAVTAELIYFWMVSYRIPFDPCQKWHLNSLLTLIHICEIKNQPSKKMKKKDIYARNRALNAARRKSLGTSG